MEYYELEMGFKTLNEKPNYKWKFTETIYQTACGHK